MKHNPHSLTLSSWCSTVGKSTLLSSVFVALVGIPTWAQDQEKTEKPAAANQSGEPPASPPAPSGSEILGQVREKLTTYRSVSAEIRETVSVGTRQFTASGRYLRGTNNRLRLEFNVKLGESDGGSLTQVCNGQLLWTRWQVGKQSQISRRDIREIQRAVQERRNLPQADLLADLGLGGMRSLLAALENGMHFDAAQTVEIDGRQFYVIQGNWKKELLSQLGLANPESDDPLPSHVPDTVRIYVEVETLFPRRVMYLKRHPEKELVRPMITLDFVNIQLNAAIADSEFEYEPPDDVQQVDDTKEYIEKLSNPGTTGN